jgi:hypothetical protein
MKIIVMIFCLQISYKVRSRPDPPPRSKRGHFSVIMRINELTILES